MNNNLISVRILDRTYRIKCPPEQAYELQQSAAHVDAEMRKLKNSSSISNTDSLAVITALNLCNEWMKLKKERNQYIETMHERIQSLQKRIEEFLATKEEVLV